MLERWTSLELLISVEVSNSAEGLKSVQNILRKIKKSSKVTQSQKTLISVFAYFPGTSVKNSC